MGQNISRFHKLRELIHNHQVSSDRASYSCIFMDEMCTVFESRGTKKVMIPTEVVLEWIHAYDQRSITHIMSAREMREIVTLGSDWAPYQHGFETHLKAVVYTWAEYKSRIQ